MDIKKFITDSRAVSPVIGVILMVAITVILAAVIGTFVLGLGDQVSETAPQASFDFSQQTSTFTDENGLNTDIDVTLKTVQITHSSGDAIDEGLISITVNGHTAYGITQVPDKDEATDLWSGTGTVSAGSSVTVGLYDDHGTAVDPSDATKKLLDYDGVTTVQEDKINGNRIGSDGAHALASGDVIRVVWTSESGSTSSTLVKYTVS